MSDLFTRFDGVFFEKTRLSALMILYRTGGATYNQLKGWLGVPDGSLYTHMEKLVAAGYVTKKKEIAGLAVQTVYSLTADGKKAVGDSLGFMEDLVKSHRTEPK